jgi:hypothetical protein
MSCKTWHRQEKPGFEQFHGFSYERDEIGYEHRSLDSAKNILLMASSTMNPLANERIERKIIEGQGVPAPAAGRKAVDHFC